MSSELIEKLIKLQKSSDFISISESHLPTLLINSDTGNIDDLNSECMNFLKGSRF
jgi:hypothetical protein